MTSTLKYSRQRESIKEYLAHTKSHPTADMVYQHVRTIYPKISLGTVYRNLSLLADLGEIVRINCGDGYEHFDGNIAPHYHVVCNHCGEIQDILLESFDQINQIANSKYHGQITNHTLIFHGICNKCSNTSFNNTMN